MEQKYIVCRAYRYKASGNWEYNIVGMYDTLSAAKQSYYSTLGAIIKNTNDFAMAILFDCFGNKILADYDDTHEEPAPAE